MNQVNELGELQPYLMLIGSDGNDRTVKAVADQLSIDEAEAGVSRKQKHN